MEVNVMNKNKEPFKLNLDQLDGVTGGAWTGDETELSMVCAGCRGIRVFVRDEWGKWRCSECNGTETMRWQDL